jgi:hypothetical protein
VISRKLNVSGSLRERRQLSCLPHVEASPNFIEENAHGQ